ncbi:hypothetical protein E2P81_ATG08621 [Venturia nashicola]|nr:hypothetical protein E2P81_ATG08621 [Venturia nashicola]
MLSKATLILLTTSMLTLTTNALPADSVASGFKKDTPPPHSTRTCGSIDKYSKIALTCAGAAQESVMFTTTQDIKDSVLDMIGEAVQASGGSVAQRYGMKGLKGLAINAPSKVLDLVEVFGAGYGLKMEANCKLQTLPFGGPKMKGTGT